MDGKNEREKDGQKERKMYKKNQRRIDGKKYVWKNEKKMDGKELDGKKEENIDGKNKRKKDGWKE